MNISSTLSLLIFIAAFNSNANAGSSNDLLPTDVAFKSEVARSGNEIIVKINISEGYQLYSDKFRVIESSDSGSTFTISMPRSKSKFDKVLNREVGYFTGSISIKLIPTSEHTAGNKAFLEAQGCQAIVGVCYPPFRISLSKPPSSGLSIIDALAEKLSF